MQREVVVNGGEPVPLGVIARRFDGSIPRSYDTLTEIFQELYSTPGRKMIR
jgi:hypothetical protein